MAEEDTPISITDEVEVEDLDEINEVIPTAYSITSYGADYPVDGLVKRLDQNDIAVPLFSNAPEAGQSTVGFQREFVWTKPQCDRFVESLLLGLPVPGIFLVKEASGKHLVLDGQQRLKTLQYFYSGLFQGKEFLLQHVQEKWKDRSYKTLDVDDRRRLDDSIIHATIVRQDEPSDDQSSIYLVFERLNSGGIFLQPQEIRVALYHGKFASLLGNLNANGSWRALYGKKSARLKDLELILRFFALHFHAPQYRRPMKEFLNRYMASNVDLQKHGDNELRPIFESTVAAIHQHLGPRAFRLKNTVNAALVDSIMIGVANRLATGSPISDSTGMRAAYEGLFKSGDFTTWITRSTADEDFVKKRLDATRAAFSAVK
ncbi:DUF262 domain-containing protein [Aquincola sp. S2]|uniref:DUF262 domain-containing protein n=1 Tax=Pseudaquabacterium terrae TaxID=2732868 RepID=A0ABX2ETC9_9BURK|nr:DUF262 domain-containing protein [Aquabacterium terrae]NRF71755.1 DUF262 domain-containing protein [Aquabacterium terrae]